MVPVEVHDLQQFLTVYFLKFFVWWIGSSLILHCGGHGIMLAMASVIYHKQCKIIYCI